MKMEKSGFYLYSDKDIITIERIISVREDYFEYEIVKTLLGNLFIGDTGHMSFIEAKFYRPLPPLHQLLWSIE